MNFQFVRNWSLFKKKYSPFTIKFYIYPRSHIKHSFIHHIHPPTKKHEQQKKKEKHYQVGNTNSPFLYQRKIIFSNHHNTPTELCDVWRIPYYFTSIYPGECAPPKNFDYRLNSDFIFHVYWRVLYNTHFTLELNSFQLLIWCWNKIDFDELKLLYY